jgi:hypothetical protein
MIWIPFLTLLLVITLLFIAALRRLDVAPSTTLIGLACVLLSAAVTGDLLSISIALSEVNPNERQKLLTCFGMITAPLTGLGVLILAIAFMRLARMPNIQGSMDNEAPEQRVSDDRIQASP